MKSKINQKGQTLIEIIMAFSLIAMTMGGLFVLFVNSLNLVMDAQDRTIAYNIGLEGIEIVKQLRDEGCSLPLSDGTVSYVINNDIGGTNNSLTAYPSPDTYVRVPGYAKVFKRKITIEKPVSGAVAAQFSSSGGFDSSAKYFMVTVDVTWNDKRGNAVPPFKISRVMLNEWKVIP